MAIALPPGADGEHATFCRICEAFCGIVATVRNGEVVAIAPDRDNPHSRGHACVKGLQMAKVTHDPDRVTRPLKRSGAPGEFVPVGWDEALDDIAARLLAVRAEGGDGAIASYFGNPGSYSSESALGLAEFMRSMGSYKIYGSGSQDTIARMVANQIVHGAPFPAAIPDLPRCDFLLIIGANPLVSNGYMLCAPRLRHDLDAIAGRGRVVVVDPRRSETAVRYEHVAIRPETDAWLMLGMVGTLVDAGLIDRDRIDDEAVGWAEFEAFVSAIDPALTERKTGLPPGTIAALARDFAAAERAAVYIGLGPARGRFGMLGAFLHMALNAVTGRYGRPGGVRFGQQVLAGGGSPSYGAYGEIRHRIGGGPTLGGKMGCALLPADIEEPGEGRVRALVVTAGNPVLTAPGGERLERALEKLDLMVALDFYVNETNRHADYILPTPTFLERADWPVAGMMSLVRPFIQYSDAVIPPVGETRDDGWIYGEIARRMGLDAPSASPEKQRLAREGKLPDAIEAVDMALRQGPAGDRFGERPEGWSRDRLRAHPHGVMLDDLADDGADWRSRLAHPDGKVRLWGPLVEEEFARLLATAGEPEPSLTLISRRDIRSINSWMHNVDRLVRSQNPTLLIHPEDAARRHIADGDVVRIANDNGAFEATAEVSDEVRQGTVCYPHGWGHAGGGRRANRTPGRNMNVLLGLGVEWVEFATGMSLIDCLPVTVERGVSPKLGGAGDRSSN